MMLALVVVAALWIVAGALVLASTRKPAEIVDLALSQNTPVTKLTPSAVRDIQEPLAA